MEPKGDLPPASVQALHSQRERVDDRVCQLTLLGFEEKADVAPERRTDIVGLGARTLVSGTLATR